MRSETLALYRPLRADIQRHLRIAPEHAERADWMAVAEILDIVQDGEVVADGSTVEMLTDAVLFALRASGDRVIDRYVAGLVDRRERAFARRIAKGTFSIWRVVGSHPQGGVWVDDALGTRKHKHLMDEALEKSASAGTFVAMRVFDAGPFLAGFRYCDPRQRPRGYDAAGCLPGRAAAGPRHCYLWPCYPRTEHRRNIAPRSRARSFGGVLLGMPIDFGNVKRMLEVRRWQAMRELSKGVPALLMTPHRRLHRHARRRHDRTHIVTRQVCSIRLQSVRHGVNLAAV